jgi:hypothetical protein
MNLGASQGRTLWNNAGQIRAPVRFDPFATERRRDAPIPHV